MELNESYTSNSKMDYNNLEPTKWEEKRGSIEKKKLEKRMEGVQDSRERSSVIET